MELSRAKGTLVSDFLLNIQQLNKNFGGVKAVDNVDLAIQKGEIHALIGPNGAGKTTLISLISGVIFSDSGTIEFDTEAITKMTAPGRALRGLARSFQVTSIFKDFTCKENVVLAIQANQGRNFNCWTPLDRDSETQDHALSVLESVGMAEQANTIASQLAHGYQRQLELAITLAMEPKLLVLDEPLAGMGRSDSDSIVEFLKKLRKKFTILLVEHDMDAVFALADRVSVMVYGRIIACGTPDEVRKEPLVQSAYFGVD